MKKMLKIVAVALFVVALGYQTVKAGDAPCPGCGKDEAVVLVDKAGADVKAKCMGCSQEVSMNAMKTATHMCTACNVMVQNCDACAEATAEVAAE
jgi:predicted RNA-binding Zn-ribbon protein involved in translation (DUF1610 family)